MYYNEMSLKIKAISENEAFARVCVASFCALANPNVEELCDIKTCVSECVTNSVVHAYPDVLGDVYINVKIEDSDIIITVSDKGVGIIDLDKARQPFYTSKPESERSGMGFTVIDSLMDKVKITTKINGGVRVVMRKHLQRATV